MIINLIKTTITTKILKFFFKKIIEKILLILFMLFLTLILLTIRKEKLLKN